MDGWTKRRTRTSVCVYIYIYGLHGQYGNHIGPFKFLPLDEVDRLLHSRASIAVLHRAHLPEAYGRRADLLVY